MASSLSRDARRRGDLFFLVAVVVLLLFPSTTRAGSDVGSLPYKIAAGPEGSSYHVLAEEYVAYLKNQGILTEDADVRIITDTSGSVGNLRRLATDSAVKFAFSQEDVAYRFYTGGDHFFPEKRPDNRDFTCVARLFDEHFYLCVRPEIERLDEIRNLYVWDKSSGSFATYFSLAEVYHPEWQILHDGDCEALYRSGAIDGFVSVESPGQWLLEREDWGFKLFSVNRTSFSNAGRVYGWAVLAPDLVPGDTPYETISVSCVLVARRRADNAIVGAIIDLLKPARGDHYNAADAARIRSAFPRSADLLLRGLIASEPASEIETGSEVRPRFTDFVMPSHPATVERSRGQWWHWDSSKAVLIIIAALLGAYVWLFRAHPRFVRWRHSRKYGDQVAKGGGTILLALLLGTVCIIAIQYLERQHFIDGNVVSPPEIMDMTFSQVVSWLMLFLISGFENGVFPASSGARGFAIALYIGYLVLAGYLLSQFVGHLTSEIMFRRERKTMRELKNHIVICNWNRRGPRVVEELPIFATEKSRLKDAVSVVILAENPRSPLPPEESFKGVRLEQRAPWEVESLKAAAVESADSVIVLLPENVEGEEEQDGVVLRTCLALRGYDERVHGDQAFRTPIAAEANLPRTRDDLYAMRVNEAVVSRAVGMKVLAQTETCPGITSLFDEVLDTASDSNEVYEVPMPAELVGEACDFVSVIEFFRQNLPGRDDGDRDDTVLPIGVRMAMEGRSGEPDTRAARFQFGHAVILHPSRADFQRHGCEVFRATDQVVLLADEDPEGQKWLAPVKEAT